MAVISALSSWYSASIKPRSVSVGTPDSDWAARAFMRCRTSPMRARPPSATCTTEAPWEALMPAWVSAVTSAFRRVPMARPAASSEARSEEHTSELQSLMRISYAVFCLKKKIHHNNQPRQRHDAVNTNIHQVPYRKEHKDAWQ